MTPHRTGRGGSDGSDPGNGTVAGGAGSDDHVFLTRCDPGSGSGPTLAVKDCIDVAGTPTTAGNPVVADAATPAGRDAACLAGARAAGARIVGKTNLHELCFGATGVNPHYGTPRNPLDPARVPGGSSSGSAVAVATGRAEVALGTDTAGSVRNPAACCGVVGLKTTFGRVPVAGTRPLAPSMDTIGPLARDVAGVVTGMALLEPGFAAAAPAAGNGRVARYRLPGCDPRIDAAVDAALAAMLAAVGLQTVPVTIAGWNAAHSSGLDLMYAEALEVNHRLVADHADRLGVDVQQRFGRAARLDASHVATVRAGRVPWQDELAAAIDGVDALVLPGMPVFPPAVRGADPASNTAAVAVSYAGFPALCVPVPTRDGPPTTVGSPFPAALQLVGLPGTEEVLVGIGALIERAVASET